MTITHTLGFPRIGAQRELKHAVEAYWQGSSSEAELLTTGKALRARHWAVQRDAGIDLIPVGDFAWYDQMLNMTALLGATPARFGFAAPLSLAQYFQLARGNAQQPAMEMTKWFDTNYHYLVPEFSSDTTFNLSSDWLFDEVREAQAAGINAKPVLIGPLTYLYLGKEKTAGLNRLDLLPQILPVYRQILARLKTQGVEWVQIDEPILALDLPSEWLAGFGATYTALADGAPNILLATYFESVVAHIDLLQALPVAGLHIDIVRGPEQASAFARHYPENKILSVGIVDGRNIWRNNIAASLQILEGLREILGERLWLAPSCSLLHVPVDLAQETKLDKTIKSWLAFATQKLDEVVTLAHGVQHGKASIAPQLAQSLKAGESRVYSPLIFKREVRERMKNLKPSDDQRSSSFALRIAAQQAQLKLPAYPTTTIGSFPQTAAIRQTRAAYKQGKLSDAAYQTAMQGEIRHAVQVQEDLGLDVLVHGEAERNDMVEYFGEQLQGFCFSELGWVQSYGSRCVKPPIIYGDIARPKAMTVEWSRYAQSLTDKPMKGMLTGPITILQWSFVRNDMLRAEVAMQIALAIRDEVQDLEQAGIRIIQIDEAALREGLPIKRRDWAHYLDWSVRAFRVATSAVADTTQIHTHMCYSEFNDILPAIAAMDADVITIETSRSDMELLDAFGAFNYPNDIGPGVYDIHSPRVPSVADMRHLMHKARSVIAPERLWINPDCGLKTRGWVEVEAALKNMVQVAHELRASA